MDATLFAERFSKVVIHELGHALGLSHCETPGCVMRDAEGKISTVDRSAPDSARVAERSWASAEVPLFHWDSCDFDRSLTTFIPPRPIMVPDEGGTR